jgi:hypothetical protein
MELSKADSRLGAVEGAPDVMPGWSEAWARSRRIQDYVLRAQMELDYCKAVRDAKAEGKTVPTAEAFFSDPHAAGMSPETRTFCEELLRLSKGMVSALEKWIRAHEEKKREVA